MLSRAQEARVRDVLANHPPGTIQRFCLEHLAAAAKIPAGHAADLAAFVSEPSENTETARRAGGVCDAGRHETKQLLAWGPPTEPVERRLTS